MQQFGGEMVVVGDNIKNSHFLSVNIRGDMLDLSRNCKTTKKCWDVATLVDEMLQTNAISSNGRLFKINVQIVNAVAVTRAGEKKIVWMSKKSGDWKESIFQRETGIKMEAVKAFHGWKPGILPKPAKDANQFSNLSCLCWGGQMTSFPIITQVQRQLMDLVNFRGIQTAKHQGRSRWKNI